MTFQRRRSASMPPLPAMTSSTRSKITATSPSPAPPPVSKTVRPSPWSSMDRPTTATFPLIPGPSPCPRLDAQALTDGNNYAVTADVDRCSPATPRPQASSSILYDISAPTISIDATIAGDDIINSIEDNSDVTITGTTSGVEDGQTVSVVLNGQTYNGNVSANTWSVTMPAARCPGIDRRQQLCRHRRCRPMLAGNPATASQQQYSL